VTDGDGLLNSQQRKKARRKDKKQRERQAHRNLDTVTSEAIAESLRIVAHVADATTRKEAVQVVDVELASLSEAQFIRKRINDALNVGEWLDDVRVALWQHDHEIDTALSASGEAVGFELRIERLPSGQ
jgi:hypothetical protein